MTPGPSRALRSALALAAAVTAARALAFAGLELYTDEAYYWLWSRRPAAGYFDHPPLVAWLIALSSAVIPGELGVRLPFLVCGGLTVIFAALLAGELAAEDGPAARERAVWLGALLASGAPLASLTGSLALPDAPVAAAFTAGLWLLARARGNRWLWAGLAVGLALLAKYTAALLAPALLGLVLWDGSLRRELRTPWPWAAGALAVLIFLPCLLWNARHGWVSIAFQLGHGFSSNASLQSFAEYLGGQLAGAGPVPLVLGVLALAGARTPALKRVAAAALLPLALTTFSAMRGKVEANWPALGHPALAAAAGVALAGVSPRRARALAWGSLALAAAVMAFFAVEQRRPRLLAGTAAVERFHGWRALAQEARALAAARCPGVGCDPEQPAIVPATYQLAGELAYYGGFRRLAPAVERVSQLDVWGDAPRPGEPFLFIGLEGVNEEFRRRVTASGERPTVRRPIAYRGEVLRELTLTPFLRFEGIQPPAR